MWLPTCTASRKSRNDTEGRAQLPSSTPPSGAEAGAMGPDAGAQATGVEAEAGRATGTESGRAMSMQGEQAGTMGTQGK